MPWYALYTKSRNEKKVADRLSQMGFEVYCPLVQQIKQWSDRKKKIMVPLLPSYVFINVASVDREKVFQVSGVVRYLYWLGKPAIIKEEEIQLLRSYLEHQTFASFEVAQLEVGQQYTITSGPFKGKEGVVSLVEKNHLEVVLQELGFKIILR
jgi:transcription antitermination factor NusG